MEDCWLYGVTHEGMSFYLSPRCRKQIWFMSSTKVKINGTGTSEENYVPAHSAYHLYHPLSQDTSHSFEGPEKHEKEDQGPEGTNRLL